MSRVLAALLGAALALTLAGCTDPDSSGQGPRGRHGCTGVAYDDVRGPRIHYGPRRLAAVTGTNAMCAGYWLTGADRRFVPQGLALDGDAVWVSGYQRNPEVGERECVVLRVDPSTGRTLARHTPVAGSVGDRAPATCRHGGGLARTDEGLWLVETWRLWLLDPDLVGTGADPVLRAWKIVAPLRGSTVVSDERRLGFAPFLTEGGPGAVDWFAIDDLVRPGVVELTAADPGPGQVAPVGRERSTTHVQGGTVHGGGLYLTQSNTRCGVIRKPGGHRVQVVPGTEDIEFDDHGDLWAISESGALQYQRHGGRPLVPMLMRLDATALLRGPRPSCDP
jgi:hypothetical protein